MAVSSAQLGLKPLSAASWAPAPPTAPSGSSGVPGGVGVLSWGGGLGFCWWALDCCLTKSTRKRSTFFVPRRALTPACADVSALAAFSFASLSSLKALILSSALVEVEAFFFLMASIRSCAFVDVEGGGSSGVWAWLGLGGVAMLRDNKEGMGFSLFWSSKDTFLLLPVEE